MYISNECGFDVVLRLCVRVFFVLLILMAKHGHVCSICEYDGFGLNEMCACVCVYSLSVNID